MAKKKKRSRKCFYCDGDSGGLLMIPYFKAFCGDCKGEAEKDHQDHIDRAIDADWNDKESLTIEDFELLTLKMASEMLGKKEMREELKDLNPLFLGPFALAQQVKGLLVPRLSEYMSTWEETGPFPVVDGTYRIFKPIPIEAFFEAAQAAGMLEEVDDDSEDEMPEV